MIVCANVADAEVPVHDEDVKALPVHVEDVKALPEHDDDEVAFPDRSAVIVVAEKLPKLLRATNVENVLADVAFVPIVIDEGVV